MPLNEPLQPIDYSQLEWGELPPLNDDTLWGILREEISDLQVNQLLWYYLGYRYDRAGNTWNIDGVDPEWQTEYPLPPDFIEYRQPTVKLTRSIPAEYKQLLKEEFGFKGYKVGEFGPRQTRRATAVSWLLSYLKSA
jgi:Domain of unknown function (DUF1823)